MIHNYAVSTETDFYKWYEPFLRAAFELSMAGRTDPYAWFECQIVLLREIMAIDDIRHSHNRKKDLIGRALRTLKSKSAPIARLKRAQQLLDWNERQLMTSEWLTSRFRGIGDCLAWRLYNYDRSLLRLMAEHEFVNTPQADIGLMNELQRLATRSARDSSRALLHAVTNILRIGDLTFREPGSSNLTIEEVKSSEGLGPRGKRQAAHRELIQQSLDTGVAEIGGRRVRRIKSHRSFKTHSRILKGAIDDALRQYASSRVIEDYLSIVVISVRRLTNEQRPSLWETFTKRHTARLQKVRRRRSDVLLPYGNSLYAISFLSRLAAPLALLPLADEHRYLLFTGDVILQTVLNMSGLERWLQARGWDTLNVLPQTEPDLSGITHIPALRLTKSGKALVLPLDMLILAGYELWTRESLEAIAESMLDLPVRDVGGSLEPEMTQVQLANDNSTAFD